MNGLRSMIGPGPLQPVCIRPAQPGDREQLADIYLDVRRRTFSWMDPAHFRHEDFGRHSQGEEQLVFDAGTEIAGFLSLFRPEKFIHMLFVLPQFQGQGVGSALLHALPGWPHERYRLKCLVKNDKARAFYLAKGFRVTGAGGSAEGDYEELTFDGKGPASDGAASLSPCS